MNKFTVITKVFDTGKVEGQMREFIQGDVESFKEEELFDVYVDVFDSYKEAKEFLKEALAPLKF